MRDNYVPDRGDIVWLHFTPQAGHEQAGHRPAVVISPEKYNRTLGLCLVMPVTSKGKGYPFEVPIPAGQSVTGLILTDQLKSIDFRARRIEQKGRLDAETLSQATGRVLALIDPDGEYSAIDPE